MLRQAVSQRKVLPQLLSPLRLSLSAVDPEVASVEGDEDVRHVLQTFTVLTEKTIS